MKDVDPAWKSPFARKCIRFTARRLVGRYGFTQADEEDLVQELTIHVLKQLPKYDADRASIKTFITRIVNNRASELVARTIAAKRDARCVIYSLNEPIDPSNTDGGERVDGLSGDEYAARLGVRSNTSMVMLEMYIDLDKISGRLPVQERRVLDRLRCDTSVDEIARELGVHRSTVYERMTSIRKRIRRAGYGPEK